ncbi:MAG: HD domain-containing protein [Fibrobacteres bacterium]|nr:HD domain-containing protein [Fibrobacterota bacterium]
MDLVPVDREDVAPGKSLDSDIVDSLGRMLLPRGTPITDAAQAKQLWMRGYLQDLTPRAEPAPAPISFWRQKPRPGDTPSSTPRFFQPVERISFALWELVADVLSQRPAAPVERTLEIARGIQLQMAKDPDAFLASLELCQVCRYGTLHAIHSAAISDLVAQSMAKSAEERRILMAAALTRDIGFLELQEELDQQSDPLTEEQQEEVRNHPVASRRLLKEAGVSDPLWLSVVEQHHERLNGSGYPMALEGDAIHTLSRILGIADIYSAMGKTRVYRAAIQGPNAVQGLFQLRGSSVDAQITQVFARNLGIFHPGLVVRLNTKELAVVTRRTSDLKHPEVRAITDADEKLLSIYPARDVSDPVFAITGIVPRTHPLLERLNHRQLWGEGVGVVRR